jgi:ankyrin repeat protein
MSQTIDDALTALGRNDPGFNDEIRKRLAPVKDRFFATSGSAYADFLKDGLHTAPAWLTDPEMRTVAAELAEFVLSRGLDVNVAWEKDGSTLLHLFALLRDPVIAVEAVTWLLEHGADPNKPKEDGDTPFQVAVKHGRTAVAEVMRTYGGR